jgi:transcriptional regulator with XRE-family HTH domain
MDLYRIGGKLVSKKKISDRIDRILQMRAAGMSQQEVAVQCGIDRPFVSRLETLGELRKGGRIALIGFPIKNKEELRKVAEDEGIEFILLFNDEERWDFVRDMPGAELFNTVMDWIGVLKGFDAVIFIASDMRIKAAEVVLGEDLLVGISLGPSPIKGDREFEPARLVEIVRQLKSEES